MFDDTYLNMGLVIPRDGDGPDLSKVTKCLRDNNGLPIGRAHNNPILDKRIYEVEYKDTNKASLAANAIAKNIFLRSMEKEIGMSCSRRLLTTGTTVRK